MRERRRVTVGGFWSFCDQTGDLQFHDAWHESAVYSRWPVLDRWHATQIERSLDWLLNAAAAGRERLDAALRAPHPGSRMDRLPPIQSQFWYRQIVGLGGGQTSAERFLGDGNDGSRGGLIIDPSLDATTIDGFAGPAAGAVDPKHGNGPGRGAAATGRGSGTAQGPGGGGGGYGEGGGDGVSAGSESGGPVVPPGSVFNGIIAQTFTADSLGMGGSGASGGRGNRANMGYLGGAAGDGGDGLLRTASGNLTETVARTQSGGDGSNGSSDTTGGGGGGGAGSGGLYLALCGRTYTLDDVTLSCPGGAGGDGGGDANNDGGDGGHGRVIVMYGNRMIIASDDIDDAELTTYQLLPGLPFSGGLTM